MAEESEESEASPPSAAPEGAFGALGVFPPAAEVDVLAGVTLEGKAPGAAMRGARANAPAVGRVMRASDGEPGGAPVPAPGPSDEVPAADTSETARRGASAADASPDAAVGARAASLTANRTEREEVDPSAAFAERAMSLGAPDAGEAPGEEAWALASCVCAAAGTCAAWAAEREMDPGPVALPASEVGGEGGVAVDVARLVVGAPVDGETRSAERDALAAGADGALVSGVRAACGAEPAAGATGIEVTMDEVSRAAGEGVGDIGVARAGARVVEAFLETEPPSARWLTASGRVGSE